MNVWIYLVNLLFPVPGNLLNKDKLNIFRFIRSGPSHHGKITRLCCPFHVGIKKKKAVLYRW